jgi:dTDP-glucose pyrophosphorylase
MPWHRKDAMDPGFADVADGLSSGSGGVQSRILCRQAVVISAGLATRIAIVAQGRPKALVEAGPRPAVVSQTRQLLESGVCRVIIVHAPDDASQIRWLADSVFAHADVEFRFAVQDIPAGPLGAFACAAMHLVAGEVVLMLADTLVDDLSALSPDSVGVGSVDAVREFCIADADHTGLICRYEDNPDRDGCSDQAVAGVYRFADADLLRKLLQEPAASGELSDLLRRYGEQRPLTAAPVTGWQDLGSYERYVAASRAALQGRAGHTFAVGEDGSLTKRGERSLMAAQARWYTALPGTATGLAPRLLGSGDGWYRTELLDYPSLSQLLLYEPLPLGTWRFLLTRLLETMEAGLWAPTRRPDAKLPAWCERKYITKTERRLARWPGWSNLRASRIVVNGVELACFDELWPSAAEALRELSAVATHACLIHGDMTFSNILLARRYGLFKLVDPGTTFSDSPGGDVRYDLAKLRQSYASGYDALSEDLFALSPSGPEQWELRAFPRHGALAEIGDEVLSEFGCDLAEVKFLEAAQFLSMVPLHCDNPDRQFALYATGLQLLTSVLEGRLDAIARG